MNQETKDPSLGKQAGETTAADRSFKENPNVSEKKRPVKRLGYPIVPVTNGEDKKLALAADFGKLYVTVRGNQIMAPIRGVMTLYERLGHIYKMQDRYIITSAGYIHLNKTASISIVTPQRVIVDGVAQPNPHIERNPKTKAIEAVNVRKIGIGFSPVGNVVIVDKTLFYNAYTYFIQSIQAKMKRVKWIKGQKTDEKENPNCAVYGIESKKPDKAGSWAFFPTEPPLGIWVNYEDQAIIDCLEEHTQRQRFGDRIAQKIVERNILKDHPAIGITQVLPRESKEQGVWASVTVYGYRNELEPRNISEILNQVESGAAAADFEMQEEIMDITDAEEEKAAMKEIVGETKDDKSTEQSLFDEQKEKK